LKRAAAAAAGGALSQAVLALVGGTLDGKRIARFILTQYTKTEKKYTKLLQHYQMAIKIPNGHKKYQLAM
jgi:hypothetical protein